VDKEITFASKKIHYKATGEGFAVVLVHGFAEDGRLWEDTIRILGPNFRLLIPDIPGSGGSDFNAALNTIDDFADSLKTMLDAEEMEKCILVGHSMGGYIGLAMAEKFPDRVKALGLFHSTAFADTEEKKATRRKGIEFISDHGAREFIRISSPNLFSLNFSKRSPEKIESYIKTYETFDAKSLVAYYEAMMTRPDRTAVLKNFRGPVLFIMGEEDKAVPLQDVLQQTHLPAVSYIKLLRNTAHMGMLENPVSAFEALKNFLDQTLQFY
jgi:pimeloyl-ACP methyl ester carboxylesterase